MKRFRESGVQTDVTENVAAEVEVGDSLRSSATVSLVLQQNPQGDGQIGRSEGAV